MNNQENKQKCTINSCNLNAYKEHQKCVLHCEKNIDYDEYIDFYREFKKHI